MSEVLAVIGWIGFYVGLVVGLLLIPLGLGGTFVILGNVVLLALATGFERVGWWVLLVLLGIAILGEVLESLIGVFTVRRFGASRWAMLGTFLGGLVGAAAGTPVMPVVGSLAGAFVGAFAGAFIAEVLYRQHLDSSLRAGWGAFVGRVLAAVVKFELGIVMIVITLVRIGRGGG